MSWLKRFFKGAIEEAARAMVPVLIQSQIMRLTPQTREAIRSVLDAAYKTATLTPGNGDDKILAGIMEWCGFNVPNVGE